MPRSSLRKHLNPWLVVVGVVAVVIFASLAGLSPYISTKAKPVPNKVQPGDNYPVNYTTSPSIPSVRIDLCSDSTNTPCIPMVPNATGTQTLIVIPGTFPTGQAHINVTNRDASGQLTSTIQRTTFVTIVAPDGSSTANGSTTTSSLGSLFGNSSSGGSTTTSSGSGNSILNNLLNPPPTNPPSPTPNANCQPADCGNKSGGPGQTQTCPDGTKETVSCVWETGENQCDWAFPGCINHLNNGPTPTPEAPQIYSVLIYYQFFINGQPHIVADVDWRQPAGTRLVVTANNISNQLETMLASSGHARFDLTGAGLNNNDIFTLQALGNNDQAGSMPPLTLNIGTPPAGQNQQYVYGGSNDNSQTTTTTNTKLLTPSPIPAVIDNISIRRNIPDTITVLGIPTPFNTLNGSKHLAIDVVWNGPDGSRVVLQNDGEFTWRPADTVNGNTASFNIFDTTPGTTYKINLQIQDQNNTVISPITAYSFIAN